MFVEKLLNWLIIYDVLEEEAGKVYRRGKILKNWRLNFDGKSDFSTPQIDLKRCFVLNGIKLGSLSRRW